VAAVSYRRVLLKVGGESLAGRGGYGIDPDMADELAAKIKRLKEYEVELAIVIGAGNIWRGEMGLEHGMDRATADQMGMLATVINALALADSLERIGIVTRVQTAIEMRAVSEPYIRLRAVRHLEKGRVVILAAGTGNPYFTTDTAAALRATELDADLLIKATKVDGVYDDDPEKNPAARRFDTLTLDELIERRLRIIDLTAATLCRENGIDVRVYRMTEADSIYRAATGEPLGTLVRAR